MKVTSLLEAQARYGEIQNSVWGGERTWMVVWAIPDDLKAALAGWINVATGQPVAHVYCNKDMAPALEQALRNAVARGCAAELVEFNGCFIIRDIRGIPGQASAHSWGCAIDVNASTNPLGGPCAMSPQLVACFTDAGFTWGGTFNRKDGMHMSLLGF